MTNGARMKTERPSPCRTWSQATAARRHAALEGRRSARSLRAVADGGIAFLSSGRLQARPLDSFETSSRRKPTWQTLARCPAGSQPRSHAALVRAMQPPRAAPKSPSRATCRRTSPSTPRRACAAASARLSLRRNERNVDRASRLTCMGKSDKRKASGDHGRGRHEGARFRAPGRRRQDASSCRASRGRPVVVYFYPKDDTSGCTAEAKDFTCLVGDFKRAGAEVLGISPDSPESHRKFQRKARPRRSSAGGRGTRGGRGLRRVGREVHVRAQVHGRRARRPS